MRQYKEARSFDAICKTMADADMTIVKTGLEKGADYCQFRGAWCGKPLTIEYNIVNGQFGVFNGFTGDLMACTTSEELDDEEWYAKLMDALYVPLDA